MRASATYLPFQNQAFDLVTSFSVIAHLPDKKSARQAIEEFSRITRPQGYVVITVPNKLFFIGTILMKIKQIVQPRSFFEQRFTPKELYKFFESSGVIILRYDSKNPTTIGIAIVENNLPKIVQQIPKSILRPFLALAEKIFQLIESNLPLTLLGARFGCVGQKAHVLAINRT